MSHLSAAPDALDESQEHEETGESQAHHQVPHQVTNLMESAGHLQHVVSGRQICDICMCSIVLTVR